MKGYLGIAFIVVLTLGTSVIAQDVSPCCDCDGQVECIEIENLKATSIITVSDPYGSSGPIFSQEVPQGETFEICDIDSEIYYLTFSHGGSSNYWLDLLCDLAAIRIEKLAVFGDQNEYKIVSARTSLGGRLCAPDDTPLGADCSTIVVNCAVSDWGDYSDCDAPCGGGSQTRTRTITTDVFGAGEPCPHLTETQDCNTEICPVNCEVSDWGDYSDCDAPCGGGSQTRTRVIVLEAEGTGEPCPHLAETQDCNTEICPCFSHDHCESGQFCKSSGGCEACPTDPDAACEGSHDGQCPLCGHGGGDPHFRGFNGGKYNFIGFVGTVYNIISDEHFQLNSRFIEPIHNETHCKGSEYEVFTAPFFECGGNCFRDDQCAAYSWGKQSHECKKFEEFQGKRREENSLCGVFDLPAIHSYMGDFGFLIGAHTMTIQVGIGTPSSVILDGNVVTEDFFLPDANVTFKFEHLKKHRQNPQMAHYMLSVPNYKIDIAQKKFHFNIEAEFIESGSQLPHGALGQSARWEKACFMESKESSNCIIGDFEDYAIGNGDLLGTDFRYNQFVG